MTPFRIRRIRDLDRLQRWMGRAIRTPESKLRRRTREANVYLSGNAGQTAAARLNIYVRDYWARCIDSLREDFPGLERVLGPNGARTWMERYLTRHPSRSYTLRNLGTHLLSFMKKKYPGPHRRMAIDMIRFEWAKIEAFDRPAAPPFDPARLTETRRRRIDRMRLRFQPHLTLLELDYPVYEIVDRVLHKNPGAGRTALPARGRCFTVVYRRDDRVYHKEIDGIFFRILKNLRDGRTLSQSCAAVQRRLGGMELARVQSDVQTGFQNAVANLWFCGPKGAQSNERMRPDPQFGAEFSSQNRLVAAASRPRRHRVRLLRSR